MLGPKSRPWAPRWCCWRRPGSAAQRGQALTYLTEGRRTASAAPLPSRVGQHLSSSRAPLPRPGPTSEVRTQKTGFLVRLPSGRRPRMEHPCQGSSRGGAQPGPPLPVFLFLLSSFGLTTSLSYKGQVNESFLLPSTDFHRVSPASMPPSGEPRLATRLQRSPGL